MAFLFGLCIIIFVFIKITHACYSFSNPWLTSDVDAAHQCNIIKC